MNRSFTVLTVLAFCLSCSNPADLRISDLKSAGLVDPSAIDVKAPRLSWIIESAQKGEKQTAYHILMAGSRENLDKNIGDLWDSQKVESGNSTSVIYGGTEPVAGMELFWKVKVWNTDDRESAWSPTAKWSMGLLHESDWKAHWIGIDRAIGNDKPDQEHRILTARYLRKEFRIEKPVRRAMVYIVGLGVYELNLNGKKVGDHVLSPGLTEYPKRSFYIAYDITNMIIVGENAVGTILGNGRYFAPRFELPTHTITYGYPKMLARISLEYEDGSREIISTDTTWKITTDGPILENNEYDGEYYDARKEMSGWNQHGYDDSGWTQAEIVEKPSDVISAQMTEPIRITETIKPVAISNPQPGVYIVDMGQNMVGWTRLSLRADRGTIVKQRFAETLREDGTLDMDNLRSARATDTYITKGNGEETFEPRFVLHGFRYVELTGYPGIPDLSAIEGRVIHDALDLVGSFECSDELINKIYQNAYWGIRGNYRSLPVDCPQRDERQAWLGDRAVESRGESYMFNVSNLYSKWLTDIFDAQKESGSICDVSPAYWPFYNDNVTWAGTPVDLVSMLVDQYGYLGIVEKSYPSLKKWVDYMVGNFMERDLMPKDQYGDWCSPPIDPKRNTLVDDPARITTGEYLGSSYFYHYLRLMEGYAGMLNRTEDVAYFGDLAERMKVAFNKEFFNPETRQYSNNSATANILALAFELVGPEHEQEVFNNLVEKIEVDNNSHVATGLIGQQYVNRILTKYGRADLAHTVNTQTDFPGYGNMIENGATTIWELWNSNMIGPIMNSRNHVMMLGDFLIWLYEDLAGIKPDVENPGFKHIIMKPTLIEGLSFVKASHKSPYGMIRSEWRIEGKDFEWELSIPVNTTATLFLPVKDKPEILEEGKIYQVSDSTLQNGVVTLNLSSGNYHFVSTLE